jgi:23S rRNA (cytidine1920-2'-O)/16S rRNA (cytidine1409-2'-O)-methyltransferase
MISLNKFASRAGEKLDFALEQFKISVKGLICADLGSDRGGFVNCLLQRGAKKVYAVERGYGLLDWKLRNDPKVAVLERTNALHAKLPEAVDFISIDVGWTPQRLIIPRALSLLKPAGQAVSLLKPQYEADKKFLRQGKIAAEELPRVLAKIRQFLETLPNVEIKNIIESPLMGKRGGNVEYLIHLQKHGA